MPSQEQPKQERLSPKGTPVRDVPRLPPGQVRQLPVQFDATGRDYARIWFGNALLLVLTAGLAWPWTHRRSERFFLHHTRLAGYRLAFRLSARDLWPRMAMVLALWLGVAGAMAGSVWTGLIGLTVGAAVWPLMSYLGLEQRVGSMSWAGRRLWFDGHWHGIYSTAVIPLLLGLPALWLLIAGLAGGVSHGLGAAGILGAACLVSCPVAVWRFMRYRQNHLRLGPLRLTWKGTRGDVARVLLGIAAWGLWSLLSAAVLVGAGALAWRYASGGGWSVRTSLILGGLVALMGWTMTMPYARARMMALIWNKTGNRHLRVRSSLETAAYVRLYLGQALKVLLTAGLYWPWSRVALRGARLRSLSMVSRVEPEVLLAYWSRRQGEAPPTSMPVPGHDQAGSAYTRDTRDTRDTQDTQPSVAARTGTLG